MGSILNTAGSKRRRHEEGKGRKELEKGIEKGIQEKNFEFVKNLLTANKFSISEIANLANVNDTFVWKVKKDLK